MNKKIKIELTFSNWKNINVMIFDIVVIIDEIFKLNGVVFFDIRRNKHIIDNELIYMLRQKNIDKEVIIKALQDKNYEFEIDKLKKAETPAAIKEIVLPKNFDYSWDKKDEKEVIEVFPQGMFDFG